MKKFVRIVGISVLLAVSFVVVSNFAGQSFAAQETQEFLPVDQIKGEMKGYGLTVFEGTEPEKFNVQIDKVWTIVKGWDMILARIYGGPLKDVHGDPLPLEEVGVISAMSGSPVYVDGKFVGIIGYKIGKNTYEAYAGITPVELMTKADESIIPKQSYLASRKISPLETPLLVYGIHKKALKGLTSFWEKQGLKVKAIDAGEPRLDTKTDSKKLKPGSSIMIVLMRGDFWAGSTGTVGFIDGKKVYALGHASQDLRDVDFPFYQCEVLKVIAGEDSFKMSGGVIGEPLGAIRKDFFAGVVGVLGEEAQMIPIKVSLKNKTGRADLGVEIVNHPVLTEELLIATIMNGFYLFQSDLSYSTIKFEANLKIKGAGTIEIKDVFITGQGGLEALFDSEKGEFNRKIVQEILNPLFRGPFEAELENAQFNIEISEGRKILTLDRAFLTKEIEIVGEGDIIENYESVELTLVLKDLRTQERYINRLTIPLVEGVVDGGTVRIRIDGGQSAILLKDIEYPRNLKELLEQLTNYYFSNNRIFLQIIYPLESKESEEIKINPSQITSNEQKVVQDWEKVTGKEEMPSECKEKRIRLIKISTPFKGVIRAGEVLTFRVEEPKEEPKEDSEAKDLKDSPKQGFPEAYDPGLEIKRED